MEFRLDKQASDPTSKSDSRPLKYQQQETFQSLLNSNPVQDPRTRVSQNAKKSVPMGRLRISQLRLH